MSNKLVALRGLMKSEMGEGEGAPQEQPPTTEATDGVDWGKTSGLVAKCQVAMRAIAAGTAKRSVDDALMGVDELKHHLEKLHEALVP